MLFEPIDTFEESPLEFDVKANLDDSLFNEELSNLESAIESSDALQDKFIVISGYVNLNDVLARNKLDLLQADVSKKIDLTLDSTVKIESRYLDNALLENNNIFTRNIEKILKDANKDSFFSKLTSIITAPVRAVGASVTQVAKGALFSVGEAAIEPVRSNVATKLAPVTQFIANRTANAVDNLGGFVQNKTGISSENLELTFEYLGTKIDSIFNASKIYENIKAGVGYVGKLQYETKDSNDKVKDLTGIIQTDLLNSLSNNDFIKNAILDKTFSEASSYIAGLDKDLVNLNKSFISLLGTVPDLIREFSFYGAIQNVKKEKNKLNYSLDSDKETSVFVGGLLGRAGVKTDDHAAAFASGVSNRNVVAVRNSTSDVNAEAPPLLSSTIISVLKSIGVDTTQKMIASYLPVVDNLLKQALTGIGKDEISLAANALYADELTSKTNIIAYCGGNLVAKGAAEIIDRGFSDRNIETRGFAFAPTEFVRPNSKSFQSIVSDADPSFVYSSLTGANFNKLNQGGILDKKAHGLANYLVDEKLQQFADIKTTGEKNSILKNAYAPSPQTKETKRSLTDSTVDFQRSIFADSSKENLVNSATNLLKVIRSKAAITEKKLDTTENIPDFDLVILSIYKNIETGLNNLQKEIISVEKATEIFKSNSLVIHADLGSTKQNLGQNYKDVYEINKVGNNAKGKITQAFFDTASPQSPQSKALFQNKVVNDILRPAAVDNMQENYRQNKLYGGNTQVHNVNAEVVTPLDDLANDFVKYGKFYSAKMWKEVYQIFSGSGLADKIDLSSIGNTFNNLNATARNVDTGFKSMFSSMKKLETLMVGDLANKYRQQIKSDASASFSAIGNYGNTQITRATNEFYRSLNSGINNAIENADTYKIQLQNSVVKFFISATNSFNTLSQLEKDFFAKLPYKSGDIAKFTIQAAALSRSPLALSGGSAAGELGGQLALSGSAGLEQVGSVLGHVPLAGAHLQEGVQVFREWFTQAFTQISSQIGVAGTGALEALTVSPITSAAQKEAQNFIAPRQQVQALPGSAKKELDKTIDAKEDFIKSIFSAKDSNEIITTLKSYTNIPAKQLYKVARTLGSSIPAKSSKENVIKELEDIAPDLSSLQVAVNKVYVGIKGITREERVKITEQFNRFASTVRAERDILITSNLPESEIANGLQDIVNQITEFSRFVNVNSQQLNSLKGLKENINQRIGDLGGPAQNVNAQISGTKQTEPINLQVPLNIESVIHSNEGEIKNKSENTGRRFSEGISEGIKQGKKEALQDVLVLARSLVLVAEEALEIHSPSDKTRKRVGIPFVQGIAKAIIQGKAELKNAIVDLAASSIVASQNAFKNAVNPEQIVTSNRLKKLDNIVKYNTPKDIAQKEVSELNRVVLNNPPKLKDDTRTFENQREIKGLNRVVKLNPPNIKAVVLDPWEDTKKSVISSYDSFLDQLKKTVDNTPLRPTIRLEPLVDFWGNNQTIEEKIKSYQQRQNIISTQGQTRVSRPVSATPIVIPSKKPSEGTENTQNTDDRPLPLRERITNRIRGAVSAARQIVTGKEKSPEPVRSEAYLAGAAAGKQAIEGLGTAYRTVTNTVNQSVDAVKRFINGNQSIQNTVQGVKGFASNWEQVKEGITGALQNFQVFGIQGSTFAKLGLGALGIFAFAKGVEFLSSKLQGLVEVSRQSEKINKFFKDVSSTPKADIERLSNQADTLGISRKDLLTSTSQVRVGFKTAGYDEKKQVDLTDRINRVIAGRGFTADEGNQFSRAITQIGSKNKFSLEEVVQQLADIGIYGSGQIAAEATGFGKDQSKFLQASSAGAISSNVVGKDGFTNLERFIKLLDQAYGTDEAFSPLVSASARLGNALEVMQAKAAKALEPFAANFVTPGIVALKVLGDNVSTVIGVFTGLAVVSVGLAIPSIISMAKSVGFLNVAMQAFQANGIRGIAIAGQQALAASTAASKFTLWGLGILGVVNTFKGAKDTYFDFATEGSKAIDKLIKKEEELRNARNKGGPKNNPVGDLLNSRVQDAGTSLKYMAGGFGDAFSSALAFDFNGVIEGAKKNIVATADLTFGSKNSQSAFGGDGFDSLFKTKEQRASTDERDNVKKLMEQRKKDIEDYKVIVDRINKGEVIEPKQLDEAKTKVSELVKGFSNVSDVVLNSDTSIKGFKDTLSSLKDGLSGASDKTRNLVLEMKQLGIQAEKNKLISSKLDLSSEQQKSFLPLNDIVRTSAIEFDTEQTKANTNIDLQSKVSNVAKELTQNEDYQNLRKSTRVEDISKADELDANAISEETKLVELQIGLQKQQNSRRKELAEQQKEKYQFVSSTRKIQNDIVKTVAVNNTKVTLYNQGENLDNFDSKVKVAKTELNNISSDRKQAAIDINDNAELYKKGLITTYEYQTNLLNTRLKQKQLEAEFNNGLIALNNIEKERLVFLSSIRRTQNEINKVVQQGNLKTTVYNKTGNLNSYEAKVTTARGNLDSISSDREQVALDINDNAELYKRGLISTQEYQTNLLNSRLKQQQLETQFNDGLIELDSIQQQRAATLLDLSAKQAEYDNKVKDNGLTIKSVIVKNYSEIRTQIIAINDEINKLTSDAIGLLGTKIKENFSIIRNIFKGDKELEQKDYALKSYIKSLEKLSGIKLNRDELNSGASSEVVQSKILYGIEVAKAKLAIESINSRKAALLEEIVIQRQIASIEREKAKFNASNEVQKAEIGLKKAEITKDPDAIALAKLDLQGALENQSFVNKQSNLESAQKDTLDTLKVRSIDLEGARLSLDLKGQLLQNDTLKPFNNGKETIDPFKNITNYIDRNLSTYENSAAYSRTDYRSETSNKSILPVLNLTNNFNGNQTSNNENLGKEVGNETLKAMKLWTDQLTKNL